MNRGLAITMTDSSMEAGNLTQCDIISALGPLKVACLGQSHTASNVLSAKSGDNAQACRWRIWACGCRGISKISWNCCTCEVAMGADKLSARSTAAPLPRRQSSNMHRLARKRSYKKEPRVSLFKESPRLDEHEMRGFIDSSNAYLRSNTEHSGTSRVTLVKSDLTALSWRSTWHVSWSGSSKSLVRRQVVSCSRAYSVCERAKDGKT